jgi:drug/metabolite transporter (DMT)-like permease
MVGLVIAAVAGLLFCLSTVLLRRGIHLSSESFTAAPITCFTGVIFFGLAILATGEAGKLFSLSWKGVAYLAGAGVLHFTIGRLVAYTGMRLIGANRTSPITSCLILVSVLLGVIFLGEPLTVYLVIATFLILAGIFFISSTGGAGKQEGGASRAMMTMGVLAAVGGAICWGVSPTLIKIGLQGGVSPQLGAFVSYAAASIAIGLTLIYPQNYRKLRGLSRKALTVVIGASVILSIAHLGRYIAIDLSPVSLVTTVFSSISTLLVFPVSFLINREIEVFSWKVILGAVVITAGIILVFIAA